MSQAKLYLIHLQKYLLGDLEKFENLCREAELEEESKKNTQQEFPRTTLSPNSFEFIYGTNNLSIPRATIPHSATLFAVIDFLGFLVSESGNNKFKNNTENIKSFFDFQSTDLTDKEIEAFTKIFRNGIIHTYFPKQNLEISYHSSNPESKLFFKNPKSGGVVLNVNYLKDIVERTLNLLITDISIHQNLDTKFDIIINSYNNECSSLVDDLKNIL